MGGCNPPLLPPPPVKTWIWPYNWPYNLAALLRTENTPFILSLWVSHHEFPCVRHVTLVAITGTDILVQYLFSHCNSFEGLAPTDFLGPPSRFHLWVPNPVHMPYYYVFFMICTRCYSIADGQDLSLHETVLSHACLLNEPLSLWDTSKTMGSYLKSSSTPHSKPSHSPSRGGSSATEMVM